MHMHYKTFSQIRELKHFGAYGYSVGSYGCYRVYTCRGIIIIGDRTFLGVFAMLTILHCLLRVPQLFA